MSETKTSSTEPDIHFRVRELCLSMPFQEFAAERRGDRTIVRLPDDRLAWLPSTPTSAEALRVENKVLGLINARCTFAVPTVLAEAEDGSTLRSMVPGHVDPYGLAARLKAEPTLIDQAAAMLAHVLAEQHTLIGEADVSGWLQTAPTWPSTRTEIEIRLPQVIDSRDLLRRTGRLLDAHDSLGTRQSDCALIHGDFGLHNVAFDADTGKINGVFDYGSAAWADRHIDFRYLVFSAVPDAHLDATITAYGTMTGVAINRHRVLVCNAAAAVSHLADRAGHVPEESVAGRTLAGDLGWTEWAFRRAGF